MNQQIVDQLKSTIVACVKDTITGELIVFQNGDKWYGIYGMSEDYLVPQYIYSVDVQGPDFSEEYTQEILNIVNKISGTTLTIKSFNKNLKNYNFDCIDCIHRVTFGIPATESNEWRCGNIYNTMCLDEDKKCEGYLFSKEPYQQGSVA